MGGMSRVPITETRTSHPSPNLPPPAPRSVPVIFGTEPGHGAATEPSHARPGTTRSGQSL